MVLNFCEKGVFLLTTSRLDRLANITATCSILSHVAKVIVTLSSSASSSSLVGYMTLKT